MILQRKTLPNYSHLVIIGNGFDLNLGLKTKYSDFIDDEAFKSLVLVDKPNLLCHYLYKVHLKERNLDNWIDVETTLKVASRAYEKQARFKNDFDELKQTLIKYYQEKIDKQKLDKTSRAYQFLSKTNMNDIIIIDFNYTNSTKRILSEFGRINNREIDRRVIKIHGSYSANDIILGVEDGASIGKDHEFIIKSNNLNYVGFNLNRLLENARIFSVFGHSLGETDHMYFKSFFTRHSRDVTEPSDILFRLYYYDDESFDSIMSQVYNLTDKKTSFFRQNIQFSPIPCK